jgi:cardiolipin synthase A/B
VTDYWPNLTFFAAFEIVVTVGVIIWVLMTKRDSTAAMAWCLVVILVPLIGAALFWVFGYNRVHRPLRKRRLHRSRFRTGHPPRTREATSGRDDVSPTETWNDLGRLAQKLNAYPVSPGNDVALYHDTQKAFDAMLEAIAAARHHIHLEYYIYRGDATGQRLADLLTEKARAGVEVRLLYDALGGFWLRRRALRPLLDAGGKIDTFLPVTLSPFRFRVNLRNHRKITVVDGRVGFTGGMNIGDEYLGLDPYFGYWRDALLRLEGPAVAALQRTFTEDWDFAYGEPLNGRAYFPDLDPAGEHLVQVAESGPDQDVNTIRKIYFAAILSARERVWIATPYFVPDLALLDALRLARYRGVDVRILTLLKPDHFLSFHASRYYYDDMLQVGAKVYLYAKGMMHTKMMLVDGQWAMVGSANLDNRSLHLNFEAGCILYSHDLITDLEKAFRRDLRESVLVDARSFAQRSFWARLAENGCRLLSPTL